MSLSRNQEHEKIMTCIYDALICISLGDEFSLEDILEGVYRLSYDEIPLFSKEIIIKSLTNIDQIKSVFQSKMKNWTFARLNTLEQAILLMSYTHSKIVQESEKGVVIDIAVKLSKKFLDKEDYKFVNAILDNVL